MLAGQIRQFWLESCHICDYRRIPFTLCDTGLECEVNRVWRLMRRAGINAQVGYQSPRVRQGESSILVPDRLKRQFNPAVQDERWVTDITYIRTHEGRLYIAVMVNLLPRNVICWSMQRRMRKDIVLNVLQMAVWRRNPHKQVLFHSDNNNVDLSFHRRACCFAWPVRPLMRLCSTGFLTYTLNDQQCAFPGPAGYLKVPYAMLLLTDTRDSGRA